jgi:peroxiredoxin
VYDGPGDVIATYGVTGFPETFVIDRDGKVRRFFAGPVNGDDERADLEAAIEDALT